MELGASVPGAALKMVGEQASGQAGEGRCCSAAWAPEPRPVTRSRQAAGSGQPGSRRAVVKAEGARSLSWAVEGGTVAPPGPTCGAPQEATSFWGRS